MSAEKEGPSMSVGEYLKTVAIGIVAFAAFWACSVAVATWPGTAFTDTGNSTIDKGSTAWMIVASALVLIMTPGLGFFYGGMVRVKNVISTLMQSYAAVGVISVLWVMFLFSLCFGESQRGFIGNPATYFLFKNVGGAPHPDFSTEIPFLLYAIFQLKFAIITPALISGSFAERVEFKAWLMFMILFSIFVYAPIAHLTWHPEGLLHKWGVLDFAGGTVVHMSSGYAALAGAIFIPPGEGFKGPKQPSHVPYIMLGTAMLLFGWYGFNAGSALSANGLAVQAFMTTHTAASSGMVTWLFCDYFRNKKLSASGACIGAVVGLVGITPAAGFVTVGAALLIGIVCAVISNIVGEWVKHRTTIDDTLDVFSCHGLGGTCGMLLTGCFATKGVNPLGADGAFYGNGVLLGKHVATLCMVGPYFFISAYILFWITNKFIPIGVDQELQKLGLDSTQHGEVAAFHGQNENGTTEGKPVGDLEMATYEGTANAQA